MCIYLYIPFNDFLIKCQDDEGHWPNSQGDYGAVAELLRCGVDVDGAHLIKLKLEIIDFSTPGKSPRPEQIKLSQFSERIPQESSPVQDRIQNWQEVVLQNYHKRN